MGTQNMLAYVARNNLVNICQLLNCIVSFLSCSIWQSKAEIDSAESHDLTYSIMLPTQHLTMRWRDETGSEVSSLRNMCDRVRR